ncbi:uracil DNA glycosylase [Rhizina undulata]
MPTPAKRKAAEASAASTKKAKSITSFFAPAAKAKFDKDAWVKTLTAEQKELLKLEIDTMDVSWLEVLKGEFVTPGFLSLKRFLEAEKKGGKKIFPPEKDIYSWSRYTPIDKVKVVILGQDPYHGPNQAHGLCFSVCPPTPAPPSLKNMYKALANDYPSFKPPPGNSGLLTPWAERGVLMLNACLTVRQAEANSHANKGWEKLTQKAINAVNESRKKGVVFMAWGTPASKRVQDVDRGRHLVLSSVHPSPLSAHRGFFTCGHFKASNEWLESKYGTDGAIDWNLSNSTPSTLNSSASKEATKKSEAPSPKKPETKNTVDWDQSFGVDSEEERMMIAATIQLEKDQEGKGKGKGKETSEVEDGEEVEGKGKGKGKETSEVEKVESTDEEGEIKEAATKK